MGVFYTFQPNLTKQQLDEFLNEESIKSKFTAEKTRNVIQLMDIENVRYFLFYYENENSLVAHTSHDLEILPLMQKLKNRFNLNIESDNEEFQV